MNKPKPKPYYYYDYHECADYIAKLMGIEDLRDIQGMFKDKEIKDVEYQDFWHAFVDLHNNIHNGSIVIIGPKEELPIDYLEKKYPWSIPIFEKFIEEFGEDAKYWVEW